MATQHYALTDTPTDLITAVTPNLQTGQTYSARYVSNGRTLLHFVEATSAPDADDPATPVQHLEDLIVIPQTGEGVYVWTPDGTGRLSINEVSV